jgi:hypothetical protein
MVIWSLAKTLTFPATTSRLPMFLVGLVLVGLRLLVCGLRLAGDDAASDFLFLSTASLTYQVEKESGSKVIPNTIHTSPPALDLHSSPRQLVYENVLLYLPAHTDGRGSA